MKMTHFLQAKGSFFYVEWWPGVISLRRKMTAGHYSAGALFFFTPAPYLLSLKILVFNSKIIWFLVNVIPFSVFIMCKKFIFCCDFLFITTDGPLNYNTDTIFSLLSRTSHCYELCEWSRRSWGTDWFGLELVNWL